MMNQECKWATFGRCSKNRECCVLRAEVSEGEERRKFEREPTARSVSITIR